MMGQVEMYLILFAIIVVVAVIFRRSTIPISLLLVLIGMGLSFLPIFPPIIVDPVMIFNIFLPLLLYEASAYMSSWKEMKQNLRPIILLSIGHVIFITFLVAVSIHLLIPELGWPLSIVLGAVISPPDDVAILAIAEKIRVPTRILTILKGEAMLNDATALIIYRYALLALLTHQFSLTHSIMQFLIVIVCETLYGLILATMIGELRLRIQAPNLQMMISILTPFIAYLPAAKLGGSGVIATVATGLFIGNYYWGRYPPDVRLTARAIWETLGFAVQSILFLLVGLDFKSTLDKNASIPLHQLLLYSSTVVFVVIIGRFIWTFPAAYIPRLFRRVRKREAQPPWQYPFVISWSGMRGGISLAAALAVPALPLVDGIYPRELLIFLVFSVIIATLLIQGLSLPWIIKKIGIPFYDRREQSQKHRAELTTRAAMTAAVLKWLTEYQMQVKDNDSLMDEIKLRINEYTLIERHVIDRIKKHEINHTTDQSSLLEEKIFLLTQILQIEREELATFWHENKIPLDIKYKIERELDLSAKHLEDLK